MGVIKACLKVAGTKPLFSDESIIIFKGAAMRGESLCSNDRGNGSSGDVLLVEHNREVISFVLGSVKQSKVVVQ